MKQIIFEPLGPRETVDEYIKQTMNTDFRNIPKNEVLCMLEDIKKSFDNLERKDYFK